VVGVRRRVAIATAVLLAAFLLPQGATAHALLQSSDPAAGSSLATAPTLVTLTFGEQPDLLLSSVKVLNSGGQDETTGAPLQAVPGRPNSLQLALKTLPDGVYTVAWRTLSTVDGHVAAGLFAFGVGVPPPAPGTSAATASAQSPSGSPAASLFRWLLYVGLVLVFGAGFVGWLADGLVSPRLIGLAVVGWVLSAMGTVGVLAVQWSDAGADLRSVLGSSLGVATVERLLALALTAILVVLVAARRGRVARSLLALTAGGSAIAMLADVLNGHAAAGGQALIQIIAQWLHVVAVGLWIGGLAALLLVVRGRPDEDKARWVRRFSTWAGVGLGAVAVTGVVRAVDELGSIDALLNTDFGRLLIAKTALLALLAVLGAANRFINVPRAARVLAGLRRVATTEVAVGGVVLLLTAILVNVAPPASAGGPGAAPPPAPLSVTASDFGTSVRMRLTLSPGSAGINQVTAVVTDYDSGRAAPADRVTLRFSLASRSGVGSSTLELQPAAPGTFTGSSSNLSIDGIWRIVAQVSGKADTVEVPFVLTTRIPVQLVDTNVAPGVPTVYTVHLSAAETVQLYLDPGRAGQNALHATYFDAAATELPVQSSTMAVTPATGGPAVLNPRKLEPGHFVADTTLASGAVTVDVVGPSPSGEQLHAHLEMKVEP
jgi:copper transport protein